MIPLSIHEVKEKQIYLDSTFLELRTCRQKINIFYILELAVHRGALFVVFDICKQLKFNTGLKTVISDTDLASTFRLAISQLSLDICKIDYVILRDPNEFSLHLSGFSNGILRLTWYQRLRLNFRFKVVFSC